MDEQAIAELVRGVSGMTQVCDRFAVDYDREADVLYISLERPQRETDSELTDDDILLSYRDETLVGITVLHASTRVPTLSAK